MQLIRVDDCATILRQGNEKLVLFCGETPWAVIIGRVCFLRYYSANLNVSRQYLDMMAKFADDYKWAYDNTIVNRAIMDQLSITI